MLEQMGAFFDARLDIYDEHQLTCIQSADEFYPVTAAALPLNPDTNVLDLGCGTGLELEWFFRNNPTAHVTGIDLAPGMLGALKAKFPKQNLTLICGSYFDTPLGECVFDAAVSVESFHHFTQKQKIGLYQSIHTALKKSGYLILTDYFSLTDEEETYHFTELARLKAEQGITDDTFYHYDTPLTIEHEIQALQEAGFSDITVLGSWGATHTVKAAKAVSWTNDMDAPILPWLTV